MGLFRNHCRNWIFIISRCFCYFSKKKKLKYPTAKASNETYTITIILSVAIAIAYWTRSFAYFDGNYARPLLIAAIAYFISAAYLNSQLLWTVMLLTIAGWWGAQTYFWTGGNWRFAGMNYPFKHDDFRTCYLVTFLGH